jgi:type II secretory ATPase GspE/PulE/Tfp pilus assembly ATPase PilB-like protein
MQTKELRKQWCNLKGFNFIDFETLTQAEEYILFLEQRIEELAAPVNLVEEILEIACELDRGDITFDEAKAKTQNLVRKDNALNGLEQLTIPVVVQSLPKRLSNVAYLNAREMRYEDFISWWDEQV